MSAAHVGELKLRRFRAGELPPEDAGAIVAHTQDCGECRAKLRGFDEEQRGFETAIPFERFAAGVERAARRPDRRGGSLRWLAPVLSVAAALAVVLTAAPLVKERPNRTKGGAEVVLLVGSDGHGPQREAAVQTPEPLSAGERVRIGYKAGGHRFVAAVSVDAQGEVTALYPERGPSLPLNESEQLQYLPSSLEFTGKGLERVVVLLGDEPLDVGAVSEAARAAFQRAGGLAGMGPLQLPGEQFSRTVLKP